MSLVTFVLKLLGSDIKFTSFSIIFGCVGYFQEKNGYNLWGAWQEYLSSFRKGDQE